MSAVKQTSLEYPLLVLYQLVSGPAELERPWDQIEALFLPGARIRMEFVEKDGSVRSVDWSVEQFAREATEHYRENGFWEREIARRTERFGNIAHIFSTYEARVGDPASAPVARGINSVQVLRHQGCWRIAGIIFQIERPGTLIPERYLESKPGKRSENSNT
jgi:hypothetical protein